MRENTARHFRRASKALWLTFRTSNLHFKTISKLEWRTGEHQCC
jgi:hypothetical protein